MMSEVSKRQAAFRLDLGSYRGEFAAEYDGPLFIEAISRPEEIWPHPDPELIIDKRNRVGTVRIDLSSGLKRDIVVKEFSSRGVVRLKSLLQDSKAARAWRGALALTAGGWGCAC